MKKLVPLMACVLLLGGCGAKSGGSEEATPVKTVTQTKDETPKETASQAEDKGARLLQDVIGYAQEENGYTICQITEEALTCGILTVSTYAYAPIASAVAEADDVLKLVLTDGTDITLTNVSDNGFTLFDQHFVATTGEAITAQMPYGLPLDEYFSKASVDDLLTNGQGDHDLLKQWRAREGIDPFVGYTPEEVMYARMWHDFTKTSRPPKLTVMFQEAGSYINPYMEESALVYPEDVVLLVGEYGADGMVVYSEQDDDTVHVYDVPLRWQQHTEEDMRKATKQVLETVTTKKVPKGNTSTIAQILETMTVEK